VVTFKLYKSRLLTLYVGVTSHDQGFSRSKLWTVAVIPASTNLTTGHRPEPISLNLTQQRVCRK